MQFAISVAVVVVILAALGFLVHGVVLRQDYRALGALYRPPESQRTYMPLLLPAHIAAAIALVWLYRNMRPSDSWLESGVRFGVAIAVLMTVHKFLVYYITQPIPGSTATKQIVFDTITGIVIGMAIAFLNR